MTAMRHDTRAGAADRDDVPSRERSRGRAAPPGHEERGAKRGVRGLMAFWKKIDYDWIFNLSGMLAYNLLMSIFPVLLVLLAVAGFVLGAIFGADTTALAHAISTVLPSGAGATIVAVALSNLTKSSGLLLVLGLVLAAYSGSRLFVAIEDCFSVIFRLRPRAAPRQNLMAFGMLLLYVVLSPVIFLASSVTQAIAGSLNLVGSSAVTGFVIQAAGLGAAFLAALILFAAIYIVVPNRPVHIKEVWRGTLVAGALLVLYELIFPLYQRFLLKPDNYGSTAGFAIVILVFFYYFALILLLGAEVNSWAAGRRETATDIPSIIHEVRAHDSTRGAAVTADADASAGNARRGPREKARRRRGRQARRDVSREEEAAGPEEPRREARTRPGVSGPRTIAALVTAALPIAMWLFGRGRAQRPA